MSASVETPATALRAYWASGQPAYGRAVTHGEAEVRALEARFGIAAPASFRRYLLTACSTFDDGGEMDGSNTAWWGLDRINAVSVGYEDDLDSAVLRGEAATALIFADHMVWSMAWAICCGQGPNRGRVFVISGPARFVARDFGAFVEQYLQDPRPLL